MRVLKLILFLVILLKSTSSQAVLSNPGEIVENSQISGTVRPLSSVTKVTHVISEATQEAKKWWTKKIKTWMGSRSISSETSSVPQGEGNVSEKTPSSSLSSSQGLENQQPSDFPHAQSEKNKNFATGSEVYQKAAQQLKTEGLTGIQVQGRKGQADLQVNKSGVPYFPMDIRHVVKLKNGKTKVVISPLKKIPHLDIGSEPKLTYRDFVWQGPILQVKTVQPQPRLLSPSLIPDKAVKEVIRHPIVMVDPPHGLDKKQYGIDNIVTHETILKSFPKLKEISVFKEKPYQELSEPQMLMLITLLLYKKGERCSVLLGLLDSLAKKSEFKDEANFYLGKCADQMNMKSLAFERLSSLIQGESKDFASEAISTLAKTLPMDEEVPFSTIIRGLKNPQLIPERHRDLVYYLTAKGAFREGLFQEARSYADKVLEGSVRFAESQFLVGISWYSQGQFKKAMNQWENLRQWMSKKNSGDKNLKSLTAMSLARIKFTQGNFKEALPLYMSIEKDHPLWVQGLVEQGWTQLSMEDFSGAIGNMYSLHSPYFKTVYKPESFVVRTVGYLKICQYGDAYRTLSWLEHEYKDWPLKFSQYLKRNLKPVETYEIVKQYLKGKSDQDVEGLPHQAIREMARQKNFLNIQSSLNEKSDEVGLYEEVEKNILTERGRIKNRMQKASARIVDLKNKLKKAETDRTLAASVDPWKQQMRVESDLVSGFKFILEMLETSQKDYESLKQVILARVQRERNLLREKAGQELVRTLNKIKKEIQLVLENNEFLRYEVFANSGENIRYQVAGGNVAGANRIPASAKPTKLLNWSFDGEYWEDEIGSYRSSLRNNCPEAPKMEGYFKGNKDNK